MVAQNPRRHAAPAWQSASSNSTPTVSPMCIVPRSPTSLPLDARAEAPLSYADWHLLFDAVKARLRGAATNPATAADVPECVDALDWLQGKLEPPNRG